MKRLAKKTKQLVTGLLLRASCVGFTRGMVPLKVDAKGGSLPRSVIPVNM